MSDGDSTGKPAAGNGAPERLDPIRSLFGGEALARGRGAALISELRRLQHRQLAPQAERDEPEAECELCRRQIPDGHRHLLQLEERRIVCACEACWAMRSGDAEYRPTGARVLWLDDFVLPDELWAAFGLPIGLAFFFHSTTAGRVIALYPSPAGATESELPLESWDELVAANPELADLEPDVEALIVDRLTDEYHFVIAPIDRCYRMVGLVKALWRGTSGGEELRAGLAQLFADLRRQAEGG